MVASDGLIGSCIQINSKQGDAIKRAEVLTSARIGAERKKKNRDVGKLKASVAEVSDLVRVSGDDEKRVCSRETR